MEFSQIKKFSRGLDVGAFTNEVTEAVYQALHSDASLKSRIDSTCRLNASDARLSATLLANFVLGTLRAQIPGLDWAQYQMPSGNPLQGRLPQHNVDFENLAQQWCVDVRSAFVAPPKFELHLSPEDDMTFAFSVNMGFPLLGDGEDTDDLSCLLESKSSNHPESQVSQSSVDELFAAVGSDELFHALGATLCGGHGLMFSCARFDFEAPLYRYESTRQREQLRVQVLSRVHQLGARLLRFGVKPVARSSTFGTGPGVLDQEETQS